MKTHILLIMMSGYLSANLASADSSVITNLLDKYTLQSGSSPDSQAGEQLWRKTFSGDGEYPDRSCTSCHSDKLTQSGKHLKTQRVIQPMAPSVNPARLTKERKIRKWLKRNCKWTLGRECTTVEKANLITYIRQQ